MHESATPRPPRPRCSDRSCVHAELFFGWHSPEFQNQQSACFHQAFDVFVRVARAVKPGQFVDDVGWNTSKSKVIDNAVVGLFVMAKELVASHK